MLTNESSPALPDDYSRLETELAELLGFQVTVSAVSTLPGAKGAWLGLLLPEGREPAWEGYLRRAVAWPGAHEQVQKVLWELFPEDTLCVGTAVFTDEHGGLCIAERFFPEPFLVEEGESITITIVSP